jgi:hypothetical protein
MYIIAICCIRFYRQAALHVRTPSTVTCLAFRWILCGECVFVMLPFVQLLSGNISGSVAADRKEKSSSSYTAKIPQSIESSCNTICSAPSTTHDSVDSFDASICGYLLTRLRKGRSACLSPQRSLGPRHRRACGGRWSAGINAESITFWNLNIEELYVFYVCLLVLRIR